MVFLYDKNVLKPQIYTTVQFFLKKRNENPTDLFVELDAMLLELMRIRIPVAWTSLIEMIFFETATFTLAEIDVLVGNSLSGLAGGLGLRTGDLLGGPVTGGEDCGGGLLLEEDEGGLEKNDKNCLGNDFSRAKNCRF